MRSERLTGSGAIAVHGGAGARAGADLSAELAHLEYILRRGQDLLRRGGGAVYVAVELIAEMEDSGLYIAGRGATPGPSGACEMDAAIVHGADMSAGAVGALAGFRNPIRVADAVRRETPHVLLAGNGAAAFARAHNHAQIADPSSWYRCAGADEANHAQGTGTVGCCVLDQHGGLAAASSTSGLFDKMPGRISDAAIIGAGIWCDRNLAICCTGQGDYFIRASTAARLAAAVGAGSQLGPSASKRLDEVETMGGWGGLIALSAEGEIIQQSRKFGMKRGRLSSEGRITVSVFDAP